MIQVKEARVRMNTSAEEACGNILYFGVITEIVITCQFEYYEL